ncbi:hypothetical protein ACLBR3_001034 [Salmonella enterica]|nr:hypothetical protein [Salmonella enterica subsp. diarizonae]
MIELYAAGNADKLKIHVPSHTDFTVDEDAFKRSQSEADVINNAVQTVQDELAGMTSTEAKIYLEQKYRPMLNLAIHNHREACDNVTRYEDSAEGTKAALRGEYAGSLRHPEIKKINVAGAEHFSHLVKSGSLDIEGYKLVDSSSLNMTVEGVTSNRMNLVYIPVERDSLMSYADTEEAHDYAEREYRYKLERLITARKKAAVQLEELRNEVAEKWNSIPDFESMFSSNVRKGRK